MECPICNSKLKLLTGIPRQIEFKKEIYKVYESYYKCEGCGEEFNDVETGDKNLIQVYNQYRENHNILYPDEIINLRKKYGLTKVDMSLALGWGENTYSNYERGAIPNESHNSLLRLIDEPKQFLKLVESRNDLFDKNEIIKIQEKVETLIHENKLHDWIQFVWPQKIKSDTGFVKPNLDKFANMVIYFVIKEKPCKTKLNKLLFYSDFLHYKNHLKAISGSRYRAISLGPVPTEYDAIYDWMNNNNFIYMVEEFKDCGVIEIMETNKYFDESLFVESEIEILNNVYEKFKDYLINDLKEYTLEEPAWKENVINKNIINYQKWGFEVKG